METGNGSDELDRVRARLASLELLVGTISHAIKGQFTGLDGGTYLLNSGCAKNDPERMKKGATMVQRNLERVRGLVLHVLYYARDREPVYGPVSPSELVQELSDLARKRTTDTGTAFSAEVAPGTGEFEADPRALQSMLLNLIEYAVEASGNADPAGRPHRLGLTVSQEAGQILFRVRDHGRAIDPETRERVLGHLFAAKVEGAALGVFIAGKIARAHGGSLEIAAPEEGGSVFLIRIPRTPACRGGDPAERAPAIGTPDPRHPPSGR